MNFLISSSRDLQIVRNKSLRLLHQQLHLPSYFKHHLPNSSNEPVTLKRSAVKLFTMANLRIKSVHNTKLQFTF